ncbi:MAG: MaoC family dehydratase [Paeniglutamicibacter terrestris]
MSELSTLILPAAPSLGSLYATATAGKLRGLLPGSKPAARTVPQVEHRLESLPINRQKLVDYQRLMGDTVRDELPSVFVHGIVFPLAMSVLVRDDFPLPLLGMVHLSNAVTHLAPIAPSAVLTAVAHAENLRGHRAGTQVDLLVEVSAGTELVWRSVSTYLARGVFLGERPSEEARPHQEFTHPTRTASWRLGAATGREYAAVLGDYNPIHLSAPSAKVLGMKSAIAHGMYLAGRALAGAAPHGTGYAWEISFATPVFLPSTVDIAITSGLDKTEFSGWGSRSGKPHFSGTVTPLA